MIENPWHAKDGTIHHNSPDCAEGMAIPEAERINGTGDLPLCDICAQFQPKRRAQGGVC